MTSMQPVNISYLKESESCYDTWCEPIEYQKKSVMSRLMRISPLTAFLAQKAKLDTTLDQENFNGTIFACYFEYCQKNHEFFKNINYLQAKEIILSSMLPNKMYIRDLTEEEMIPSMNRYTYIDIYQTEGDVFVNGNVKILRSDINCSNGVIHVTNGLIPDI